jgi:hypothetical protein
MKPNSWISRTSTKGPSVVEIVWMIFTSAAVIQVLQTPTNRRSRGNLLLIPPALALITSWTSYSFIFLTLSIPCLTISILKPNAPSIPFLFPSLLPHSVNLRGIVNAGFNGWALIWPTVLVTFVLLSISLNGDVFRGLFVTSPTTMDTPIEKGVAPYGTRIAIFGTIVLLLCLAICLSVSNMIAFCRRTSSDTPRRTGRESGVETRARYELVFGIRWLLGDLGDHKGTNRRSPDGLCPPPLPLPLNLMLIPLDTLLAMSNLVRLSSQRMSRSSFRRMVSRIRYYLAVVLLGVPCWLLSFVL